MPAESEIASRLKEILVTQLGVPASEILPETDMQTIGADSLDAVEIAMSIEEEFNIEIRDESEEMKGSSTFSALIQLVQSKL